MATMVWVERMDMLKMERHVDILGETEGITDEGE